ncbi:MAG: hypothetical protein ACQEW9_08450 [Bacteroidota bacterium]|uniref:AhpC/TSA family protein n=1 Tax=Algoriphagus faecimaris TaxID=686796 RepID=A0A1G6SL65_9BACT|nr:hypothetical protein [Algoriphagus faecimaris]SDD17652.1 hypothetical protein SAMN04488104_101778 [Algoriphagus faecimaris]
MKNRFAAVFLILFSCSEKADSDNFSSQGVNALSEMVTDRYYDEDFFLSFKKKFSKSTNGFLFILPSSSCFNCFDYLTDQLGEFIGSNHSNQIVVVKSENIKDREIMYAFRKILDRDSIQILNNTELDQINQHEFYPKLGYIKNGNLSCIAVFEQGNDNKVRNYFKFIDLMIK